MQIYECQYLKQITFFHFHLLNDVKFLSCDFEKSSQTLTKALFKKIVRFNKLVKFFIILFCVQY